MHRDIVIRKNENLWFEKVSRFCTIASEYPCPAAVDFDDAVDFGRQADRFVPSDDDAPVVGDFFSRHHCCRR